MVGRHSSSRYWLGLSAREQDNMYKTGFLCSCAAACAATIARFRADTMLIFGKRPIIIHGNSLRYFLYGLLRFANSAQ